MSALYLGRIVAVARTPAGSMAALYRVSSRSFPNRRAVVSEDGKAVGIVPRPGFEADIAKNPYIAYNCARLAGEYAVFSNGSHTDPVAEKIASGYPVRDAMALSLLALDYEKDGYSTPRVCAVARLGDPAAWLGAVRKDGLDVREFSLEPGTAAHLSTYEHGIPSRRHVSAFDAGDAPSACEFILRGGVFAGFANPVTAAAAVERDGAFEFAARDA